MLRATVVLLITAALALPALAQSDLERAQNLATCLGGRYPSLCKKAWLTPEERGKVDTAERRENLNLCLQGRYPALCKKALLTQSERAEVLVAEKRENLRVCLTGRYRALCNTALLAPEERSSVRAAETQENLKICLTGRYPSLCDRQLLTREQAQHVQAAEVHVRNSTASRAAPSRGSARARGGASDCESGHWVESVSGDGQIVKLEDGSIWEVDAVDRIDSMLWLPATDIVACEDKLINTDDNETVSARRLR